MTETYSKHVGEKFNEDGSVKRYSGNTIICFLAEEQPAYQASLWAQEQLKALNFAHKYAFLPPSSFHMTVMGLVLEEQRSAEYWSDYLDLTTPLSETDAFFTTQLAKLEPPKEIAMRYHNNHVNLHPSLRLEPKDKVSNKLLGDYRNHVSELTGVHEPNHDSYAFHISICYPIIDLTIAEQSYLQEVLNDMHEHLKSTLEPFSLSSPELCFFDDMFAFFTQEDKHLLGLR